MNIIFQLDSCLIQHSDRAQKVSYYNILVMLTQILAIGLINYITDFPMLTIELLIFSWLFLQYSLLNSSAIPVNFVTVPIFQTREPRYSRSEKHKNSWPELKHKIWFIRLYSLLKYFVFQSKAPLDFSCGCESSALSQHWVRFVENKTYNKWLLIKI